MNSTFKAIILVCLIATIPVSIQENSYEFKSPHKDRPLTEPNECTTAIISGEVTADGRPLLWKNRDVSNPEQEFAYFDDGEFEYVTNTYTGQVDDAWGGVNSVGFAIENSTALNLPDSVEGPDDDGRIMKLALQTCRTVDDFIGILDATNEVGRTTPSNYGVIDAEGGAAVFEAGFNSYLRFDATDSDVAPDGFLVRTNFAYSGVDTGRIGKWRHDRAYQLILDAIEDESLTPQYLFQTVMRDISLETLNPYPLPFDSVYQAGGLPWGIIPDHSAINRDITRSAIIVQGILNDENPLLSTTYAVCGEPIVTVPVPLWVHAAGTPVELNGDSTALLCDLAKQFVQFVYSSIHANDALNTFQLLDGAGNGVLKLTNPVADTIFSRTQAALDNWREDLPEGETVADFQNEQAGYVYETLNDWQRTTNRHVPDDWETIQTAINASANDDTVLVQPGVYEGVIDFNGRDIIVASLFMMTSDMSYIDSTILDGIANGRSVAVFHSGETVNAKLVGFTMVNAMTGLGGGIYCNGASPTLQNLVIRDNHATRNGGGLYCTQGSNPSLINVTITGNLADGVGGGIHCYDNNSGATIVNSIVRNNQPAALPAWLIITYSNIQDGFAGEGNIDLDPLFVEPDSGNLHLSWDNFPVEDETKSPCIDSADPASAMDPDVTRADMGAFFFHQGNPQEIDVDTGEIVFVDIQTETYVSQSVTISNVGDRLLAISSQSIVIIEGPPFIYIDQGGGPFEIWGEGNHETVITFAPWIAAEYSAIYRIESNDMDEGSIEIPISGSALGVGTGTAELPTEFYMTPAHPNPFNSRTSITYGLPVPSYVSLDIYNLTGCKVVTLFAGYRQPGIHTIELNATNLPSGLYFVRLEGSGQMQSRKVMLIR